MPLQLRNNEAVGLLSADFQKRAEPNFAWQNVLSMYCMLPGIRGFWPTSSFGQVGANDYDLIDLSGQGRHLTGAAAPLYGHDGLAPYVSLDGQKDWFSRATETGLQIQGNEAYVVEPGLTLGGWWWFDAYGADRAMIAKWVGPADLSYLLYYENAAGQWKFSISQNGAAAACAVGSSVAPATGQWYYIVGRFDNTANTIDIWGNTTQNSGACATANIFSGAADLTIGATAGGGTLLDGRASLVFLCASALPDYTINALYGHTKAMFKHV